MSTEELEVRTAEEEINEEEQIPEGAAEEEPAAEEVTPAQTVTEEAVSVKTAYVDMPASVQTQAGQTRFYDTEMMAAADEAAAAGEGAPEPEAGAGADSAAAGTAEVSVPKKTTLVDMSKTRVSDKTVTVTMNTSTVTMNAADAGDAGQEGAAEQAEGQEDKKEVPSDPETEAIKEKIRERKRANRRKARRRRVTFWIILYILLISAGLFALSLSGLFTVDSIEVKGNSHFTAEEIINIGHAVPGHNIIYDLDSKEIVEYLEQNPYIKTATVTRKLPSTMVITVDEREQACAFKYDDDYLIMDDEGILLRKTGTEPKLTMVTGLVVSKIKLGETIGTENQQMFSKTLKLIRAMNEADMYFVKVDMTKYEDDTSVKAYIYNKLVVKAHYDALMDSLENGRLHKVTETLFEDSVKRGTITFSDDGSASFEPGI